MSYTDTFLKLVHAMKMKAHRRTLSSYMGSHVDYNSVDFGINVTFSLKEVEELAALLGTTRALHGVDVNHLYNQRYRNAPTPNHHNEYES